jgi:FkbM family methyltransferase
MQSITLEQYEQLQPSASIEVKGKKIVYNTPNRHTAWRVQTLFSKEPDTIEWISGFEAGSTLLDIGANVGMYSVFAAALRGCRVHAFEPESQNFALLNRNIFSNRLGELVTAYPVALSDGFGFDKLHLSQFIAGGSCHNFGEAADFDGRPFTPRFSQGCIAVAVDDLIERHGLPAPDYIKVDVDGIEHKVIAGARRLLESGKVRSVLIEINTNRGDHRDTVATMESMGYRWSPEQVEKAQRTEGAFKGVGNYIFVRA